jgi:hypothetical protein
MAAIAHLNNRAEGRRSYRVMEHRDTIAPEGGAPMADDSPVGAASWPR